MAPLAQVLGSANGDTTLIMPLTTAVPADGLLQVIIAQVTVGATSFDINSAPEFCVDSQNRNFTVTTSSLPMIGLSFNENDSPAHTYFQTGSAGIRACHAGDLKVGGTVTVTFTTDFPSAPFHSAGLVVYVPAYLVGIFQPVFPDGPSATSPSYHLDDNYPNGFVNEQANALRWTADSYTSGVGPISEDDAIMLTAMAARPAIAGFTPTLGVRLGEIASGAISVACGIASIKAGVTLEPGGMWPSSATQLAGNFQLLSPIYPGSPIAAGITPTHSVQVSVRKR